MTTARYRPAADRSTCAGIVLGALVLTAAADTAADGEKTPMFGGAVVGALGPDPDAAIVGVELEAAWWHGRFGLGLEGSMHWDIEGDGARATVLGASARVRVLERLFRSLLEPRDVELGLELHAIIERTWWDGALSEASPTGHGLGLAVRLRGGADEDSTLLAESRLFVRVLSAHRTAAESVARTTMSPAPPEDQPRELTILVGIGAAFGAGEPRYLDRFRLHPFDESTLRF
jgi:hypothetical protein